MKVRLFYPDGVTFDEHVPVGCFAAQAFSSLMRLEFRMTSYCRVEIVHDDSEFEDLPSSQKQ
jgi:hypothetical protein